MAFSIALGGSIYRTRWLYHPHRWLNLFAILTNQPQEEKSVLFPNSAAPLIRLTIREVLKHSKIIYATHRKMIAVSIGFQSAPFSCESSLAGGKPSKRLSPPATTASPEYSRPQRLLLRLAFAHRRSCSWRSLSSDEGSSRRN